MHILIDAVAPGSPAELLGIVPGDRLVRLNGRDDLEDMFDYQFEISDCDTLSLALEHADGSASERQLQKNPEEDPGMLFSSPVFTPIKTCNNACPFCFIDQQPQGLRPSLYLKDDDYRLSYFANTYITLTNLTPHDRARIERIRPGPLYISVHATTPEVRQRLLVNNKQGGKIMEELSWLKSLGIPFHAQVVLCPGINDGDVLSKTLEDLATLRPEAESVAVVPVGLTQYRGELAALTPVDEAIAKNTLERVLTFEKKHGKGFVYLSDEFYLKQNLPLPAYDSYGDFPQLEDGVGTARLLTQTFHQLEPTLPASIHPPRNILVLTGQLGVMTLAPIVQRLNAIEGLYADLIPVKNQFWGEDVGVAGLITGQDIFSTLSRQPLNAYAFAVIPRVMLKEPSAQQSDPLFLDGMTVSELSQKLGLEFKIVWNPYDAQDLVNIVLESESGLYNQLQSPGFI